MRAAGAHDVVDRHFEILTDLARRGEIAPVIAATFPLHQAAHAQEELARRHHVGKIVLAS